MFFVFSVVRAELYFIPPITFDDILWCVSENTPLNTLSVIIVISFDTVFTFVRCYAECYGLSTFLRYFKIVVVIFADRTGG